ncbi:TetR/AcrR family transcriptional regulator [Streptantibioticus cattleyicolor]|nr:TetR/AcrR family transcriptional regulator [Streptantibioticus cattleyicolor]
MAGRTVRADRAAGTREAIMTAAERLFAEHGLVAVSSRQISEAAGQGNNTAVGYHFGGKTELVRAIMRRHTEPIEDIRRAMLARTADSAELRDWVACLVRPVPVHLATLGTPSWYARCAVQIMTDPMTRAMVTDEALTRDTLRRTVDGLDRCLAALPERVRAERGEMARHLIIHTCAERERALAEGTGALQPSWEETATSLTDAITGLLLAPVTPRPAPKENRP